MAFFRYGPTAELTDSSPYIDLKTIAPGNKTFRIDGGGNWRTVLTLPFHYVSLRDGGADRHVIRVRVQQDATGGRTMKFSPGSIFWKAGSPPVMPTGANLSIIAKITWMGPAHGYFGELI